MDQLYINGRSIELSNREPVGFTYQVNDIAQLSEPQASYSNRFSVPDTNNNDVALNQSNTVSTNTLAPYRKLPATFIRNGIPIIENGVAVIEGSKGGYEITLYSGIFDFFTQLEEKTLKDIDFEEYNHEYDVPTIKAINESYSAGTSDIAWPLIQWGAHVVDSTVDVKYQQPIIRFPVLIDKIFELTDYTKSGIILNDGIYQDLAMTLSPDEYQVDEADLLARSYKATLTNNVTNIGLPSQGGPSISNLIHYFNNVTFPGFTSAECIYTDTNPSRSAIIPWPQAFNPLPVLKKTSYQSRSYSTVEINVKLTFAAWKAGSIDSYRIYKNDKLVRSQNIGTGGTLLFNVVVEDTYTVDLKPGDEIKVQLYATDFIINNKNLTNNFLSITAINTIPLFSILNYNQLMPEYKLKDIIRGFCEMFGLIITTSSQNKELNFTKFSEIKANIRQAEDWSDKLDLTETPAISYRIGSYAQSNRMRYAPDEFTDGYGDSSFQINDTVLVPSNTLVELIWPSAKPLQNIITTSYKFKTLPVPEYYDAPQWRTLTAYAVNDLVGFNLVLYKCILTVSGMVNIPVTNVTYWQVFDTQYTTDDINQGIAIDRYTLVEADPWSSIEEYSIGDEVNYANQIWVSLINTNINFIPQTGIRWELRNLQYEQSITSAHRLVLLRQITPTINNGASYGDTINYTDGVTTTATTTDLYPVAYFGDTLQPYNLTWQYLLEAYYTEFQNMLNQLKVVNCLINLNELDIQELDFLLLKYIEYFGNHFYLNRVDEYIEGQSTNCQLIRM